MQSVNRQWLYMGAGVLVVFFLGLIFFFATANKNTNTISSTTGQDSQKIDQNSGDTVSNPPGKTPDTYGLLPNVPTYLGLTNLIDNGLSDTQIDDVKYAFYTYATSVTPHIQQVSVSKTISIAPRNPNANDPFGLTFKVVFDNKTTVDAALKYSDAQSIQLVLSNSGKTIFDSGVVVNKGVEAQ